MYKNCRNLRRAFLATTHAQESVQQKTNKKQIQKRERMECQSSDGMHPHSEHGPISKPKQIDNHKAKQIKSKWNRIKLHK